MTRQQAHPSEQPIGWMQRHHRNAEPSPVIRFHRRPPGHSLMDEIPPKRQQAARPREWFGIEVGSWDDVAELIAGVLVVAVLFIGTPLLLWLIGTPK